MFYRKITKENKLLSLYSFVVFAVRFFIVSVSRRDIAIKLPDDPQLSAILIKINEEAFNGL